MRFIFSIPNVAVGGFSSFAINLGGELRKRGHWVGTVAARPYGTLFDQIRRNMDCTLIHRRGFATRRRHLRNFLDAMNELQVDVIVNNCVPAVQAAFPYIPSHVGRMSVVHSVHPREVCEGAANAAFTDCIVSVSPSITSELTAALAERCRGVRVQEIPVGIPAGNRSVGAVRGDAGPLRMVYCGRLSATAKNLPLMVQILSELNRRGVPFTFTFIGDGEMRPFLEAQVARTPFNRQVRFLGFRTPAEIPDLLACHDLFLLCSQYEGTPHALLEAMAAGVPCVAPRLAGSTDAIMESGVTGFLCDHPAPGAYADQIERLHRNRLLLRTAGQAARAVIREKYSVEAMADSYLQVAEEAVTRRRSGLPAAAVQAVQDVSRTSSAELVDPVLASGFQSLPRALRSNMGDLCRWVQGVRPAVYPKSLELTRWRDNFAAEEAL